VRDALLHNARWFFDRVQLAFPHLGQIELYTVEDRLILVASTAVGEPETPDGQTISAWLEENTPVWLLVEFAIEPPQGASRLMPRSMEERLEDYGFPSSWADLVNAFLIRLPKSFPPVNLTRSPEFKVISESSLTTEQRAQACALLEQLGVFHEVQFETTHLEPSAPHREIWLPSSRALANRVPRAVLDRYAEDEQKWLDVREAALTNPVWTTAPYSNDERSRCVVESWSPLQLTNLRVYLSMYDTLVFPLPHNDGMIPALKGWNITEDEFIELVRLGRLEVLVPQHPEHHNIRILERLSELDKGRVTYPRALEILEMREFRQRLPLWFPGADLNVQRALAQAVSHATNAESARWLNVLRRSLENHYASFNRYATLGMRGAIS
jgi:hypothetical protein